MTPVKRLSQYYASVAATSTLDYIGYCFKRLYPNPEIDLNVVASQAEGLVFCSIAKAAANDEVCLVLFYVPIDAGGAQIKLLCCEASEALEAMVARLLTK